MWSHLTAQVVILLLMIPETSCFVNIVHDQKLTGEAAMGAPPQKPDWSAGKAIDGDINQNYESNSCAITEFDKNLNTSIWWKVWLMRKFNVAYVEIYFRSDTYYRSSGFSIYTYIPRDFYPLTSPKHLIYHHNPMTGCPNPIMNITVNNITQGIAFLNTRRRGYTSNCLNDDLMHTGIEICEIRIMGCDDKKYSTGCNKDCPRKCKDQLCDAFNGSCIHGCSDQKALTVDCIACNDGEFILNKTCVDCPGHCKNAAPCNKLNGLCPDGCANNWTGTFCNICPHHFYGRDCNTACGHCANDAVCHNETGDCPGVCQDQWQGQRCDECKDGFYSPTCTKKCGICLSGLCNKEDGHCSAGCAPNYSPPLCQKCLDGFYNSSCTGVCGHCKNGSPCSQETGYCTDCQTNFKNPYCKVCNEGYYGKICDSSCGHCVNGETCDIHNGTCHNGCVPNYQKPKCEVCQDGFYNATCSAKCGHCIRGESCEKQNGICINGCSPNFQPPLCQVCKDGFYNSNCSGECGKCLNETVCNKFSGTCVNGCKFNFRPPLCQECVSGFYNSNCTAKCGQCLEGVMCDKESGRCATGCKPHFHPPLCQECEDYHYGENCILQCGNCANGTACDKINGSCENECSLNFLPPLCKDCIPGFYGEHCNRTCSNCNSSAPSCNRNTGVCFFGCNAGWESSSCTVLFQSSQTKSGAGAIAGGVVAVLIVLVTVGVVGVIYKRRKRGKNNESENKESSKSNTYNSKYSSKGKKYADLKDDLQDISAGGYMNEALTRDDGGYYNTTEINTVIRVEDLHRVVSDKNAGENGIFQSEYKKLQVGNTSLCNEGKKQENVAKNRFKTTYPYDHSRIILKETWNEGDNDYINANFIKDYNGQRMYIAAQGPKNNTLADFWRMIWQENVRFIVMLTNIIENGKNKCTQYWPVKDKILEVGPCKMQLLKENVYAFHTYRKFTVQNTKCSGKRTITQFHYTAWPDHGTPEELGLVQFHKAVTKSYQQGGLMLVHCSAGVGRTGTFIGLDSLLKQGRETGNINVFEFVKQMRGDRMTMVQTPDQYVFLHKALLFGFQGKDTVIRESDIPTKLNTLLQDSSPLNQRALYKEYKFLQTVKPIFEDEDKEDGMKPENKDKNSNMNVIPVSKYRPYLTSYVKGRNDYINAVCVQSFSNLGAFILTQVPLAETKVDLWTLCVDHDVKAIVFLSDDNEGIQWVPKRGCSCICAPYTLTSGETGSSISGVTQDKLLIQTDGTKQDVDVFHIPFENDNAMIKGVELLLDKGKESEFTSVVISKDGSGPTGIFCVLHNALQQLRINGEVDILTTVRLIQTRRPEVITKMEEYRKCYELLSLYVSDDGIYANM